MTRFLILPWIRVPHLASHVLGAVARRISADWQGKYGRGLDWLETFVEQERFAGTCYRAANWQRVGQTTGVPVRIVTTLGGCRSKRFICTGWEGEDGEPAAATGAGGPG